MHKETKKYKMRHFQEIADNCWIDGSICQSSGYCWECSLYQLHHNKNFDVQQMHSELHNI